MIPYGKQSIDRDDIRAVIACLQSDWLTQGPKVKEFEEALAGYCGARYAVAVSSGTAALHIACLAAGIRKGDEVITTPITFVASANCIVFCGGKPVFADIQKDTNNIDPKEIRRKSNLRTKAIIPVDFAGHPCDIENIHRIAKEYDLVIIEDGCHALGAQYKAQGSKLDVAKQWLKVGTCEHADMTVFSFHPVKHITTGEGGMILTNNADYYKKLNVLRSHGITKDLERFVSKDDVLDKTFYGPWYYEMQELGFNYRITDIQCALGLSQLKKLDSFVERRRAIAVHYNEAFKCIEAVKIPSEPENTQSSYHLYTLQVDFDRINKSRTDFMEELKMKEVSIQVHYIPVHLQPYYKKQFNCQEGDYPNAESYYRRTISLPLYPAMTDGDVSKVISAVKGTLNV